MEIARHSVTATPQIFTAQLLNGADIRTRFPCTTLQEVKIDFADQLKTVAPCVTLIQDACKELHSDEDVRAATPSLSVVVRVPPAAELENETAMAEWMEIIRVHGQACDVAGISRAATLIRSAGGSPGEIILAALMQLIVQRATISTDEPSLAKVLDTCIRAGVNLSKSLQIRQRTALMVAVESGLYHILHRLCLVRMDVNATNDNGSTALMFAAREGRLDMVRLLIRFGADVNVADNSGVNVLGYASNCGNHKVVDWIFGMSEPLDTTWTLSMCRCRPELIEAVL